MCKFSTDSKEKIGNAMIYIANVLVSFENGSCNSTDVKIDFSELLSGENRSDYEESLSVKQTADAFSVQYAGQTRML